MTAQEVETIIAKEYEGLMNQRFPELLPPWLLDNFEKIIFEMPQKDNNYFTSTIESIIDKNGDTETLSVYAAGFLLKLWSSLPPQLLCVDLKTFLQRKKILEPIIRGYDHMMKIQERKLQVKKESYMAGARQTKIIV